MNLIRWCLQDVISESQTRLEEAAVGFEATKKEHLRKLAALDAELTGHSARNKKLLLQKALIGDVQKRIAVELKEESSSEIQKYASISSLVVVVVILESFGNSLSGRSTSFNGRRPR